MEKIKVKVIKQDECLIHPYPYSIVGKEIEVIEEDDDLYCTTFSDVPQFFILKSDCEILSPVPSKETKDTTNDEAVK